MPNVGDAANAVEIAGYMVVLGLVTWLVRRVFTHTIPRLAADYKESLEKQQAIFTEHIDKQQELFQAALSQQRTDFKEALTLERTDFKEALREEREHIGKRLDRLSDAVERLVSSRPEGGNGV
jgi:hypothetical protein